MDKAIIEERVSSYKYRIRIPRYDKAQSVYSSSGSKNLLEAQVCTLPGMLPEYKTGDIVWVDYESNNIGNPVILGQFYRQEQPSYTKIEDCNLEESEDFTQIKATINGLLTKV